MENDRQDAAEGHASATAMVLESLIELLIARGALSTDAIVEAIDVCAWSVEEQPTGRGFSEAKKAAQHAALQSLLERLRSRSEGPPLKYPPLPEERTK